MAHLGALALGVGAPPDVGSTGLVVGEPGDRGHLEPLAAARGVGLDVPCSSGGVAEITGAEVEHSVGETEVGEQRLAASEYVLLARDGLRLGGGDGEELDLVELVDAEQPAGVTPGRARLPAEAAG